MAVEDDEQRIVTWAGPGMYFVACADEEGGKTELRHGCQGHECKEVRVGYGTGRTAPSSHFLHARRWIQRRYGLGIQGDSNREEEGKVRRYRLERACTMGATSDGVPQACGNHAFVKR